MHRFERYILKLIIILSLFTPAWSSNESRSDLKKNDSIPENRTVSVVNYPAREEEITRTITYENGDILCIAPKKDLVYDKNEHEFYYKYLLSVYTFDQLTEKDMADLGKIANGKIIGRMTGAINMVQIKTKEETLSGLLAIADKLMENDNVLYADIEYPLPIDETAADGNPWSSDADKPQKDRGNENKPKGNDWWAEAIGAYAAWENNPTDRYISVGIIDNGFHTEHPDLKDKIQLLPGFGANSPEDHGTHVAGIVGAINNNIGIRGIADKATLLCADWSPEEGVNLLNSGAYVEMIKQMIERNVRVINNSWGFHYLSKKGYINDLFKDTWWNEVYPHVVEHAVDDNHGYEEYEAYIEKIGKRSAKALMISMAELIMNGHDFIIVQSAGNGYDNKGPGIDAKHSLYYRNISEDIYNLFSQRKRDKLREYGITYESIAGRKIIVGAVKNSKNKGNYKMTDSSNFGLNVDICAPGEDIYSTITGNSYKKESGTSMAAPMVAASAAYCWNLNPSLTGPEIKEILRNNHSCDAYGVGEGSSYKYPMLNIGLAAQAAADSVSKYPEVEQSIQGLWVTYSSLGNHYYFKDGEVTIYEKTDVDGVPPKVPFHKRGTEKYTIEKLNSDEGRGYRIKLESGTEFWWLTTNELSLYFLDSNGQHQYSGSGSLYKVSNYTVNDLIIQE